jgi:hypothetical protein
LVGCFFFLTFRSLTTERSITVFEYCALFNFANARFREIPSSFSGFYLLRFFLPICPEIYTYNAETTDA